MSLGVTPGSRWGHPGVTPGSIQGNPRKRTQNLERQRRIELILTICSGLIAKTSLGAYKPHIQAILLKYTKWIKLHDITLNQKNNGTLFSSILKVEEGEVPLVFCLGQN